MSFWSTEKLKTEGRAIINPYSPKKIESASFNLSLGEEYYISPTPDTPLKERVPAKAEKDRPIIIPPGQFAFLTTEEKVSIPNHCLGFISVKFKVKAKGLINVSGFHVDPGYSGKLIFAVYNASAFHLNLAQGEEIFSMWICDLDQPDSTPKKNTDGFKKIPSNFLNSNDPVSSIPILTKKIELLEKNSENNSVKVGMAIGLLIPIDIALLKILVETNSNGDYFLSFLLDSSKEWVLILLILLTTIAVTSKIYKPLGNSATLVANTVYNCFIFFVRLLATLLTALYYWSKSIVKEHKN